MATQGAIANVLQSVPAELANVLDTVARPKGVDRPALTFGEDHSGDAAVWVVFPVTTKIRLSKRRIGDLSKFAEDVRSRLRDLRLQEIAYVRFSETDQDATDG